MDDIKVLAESIFTVEEFKEEPVDSKNWISLASYNSTIVPEDGELLLVTFPEKVESNVEEEGDLLVVTIPVKEENNAEEEGGHTHPVTIPLKEENNAEEDELEPPLAVFIEPNNTFEDESMQEEMDTFAPSNGSTSGRQEDRSCPPGAVTTWTKMNSVSSLLKHPFRSRSEEEKYEIKRLGRPKPLLKLIQTVHSKNRSFRRKFKLNMYKKFDWMCGCEVRNALFCFCCILFGGEETWTKNGMDDLNHLHDCARKHAVSKVHLRNALSLAMLGHGSAAQQMDSSRRKAMEVHNQKVAQNRHVLNIIINRIKFYGSLALALGGHESETSSNPDIFKDLINFSAQLDGVTRSNILEESAFEGFSKNIQNEIMTCMLDVCHEEISKEMKNSEFIALIADETSDASVTRLVIVYRYLVNFKPVERFWGFVNPEGHTTESIAASILTELHHHFEGCKEKLIAQTYNGASLLSGLNHGVQAVIKEKYKQAMYIHCHAHQLNLVLLNAASVSKSARIFFINLEGLCSFFSNSVERRTVLGKIMQTPGLHKWNINSKSVDIIYRNRMDLIECMKQIQQDNKMSRSSVLQASGFIGILNNENFIFWLSLFQKIMPHINMLRNRLKKCNCTPTAVSEILTKFELEILKIRNEVSNHEDAAKKRKTEEGTRVRDALDVCDAILMEVNDRFSFVAHLGADLLFVPNRFPEYERMFPKALVKDVVEAYPFIEEKQLCTELSVIYSAKEFRNISGALPLMEVIGDNDICSVFSKCVKLLSVVLTMPMVTSEAERCFSHQRIKNFLRKTVSAERSSALAMISIERDFIMQIGDFNERVINKFATKKERCADFSYKQMDTQT